MKGPLRVLLVGAAGRMGRAVAAVAENEKGITIAQGCDAGDDIAKAVADCDVIIDFSSPEGSRAACAAGLGARKPLVIGTTGLNEEQRDIVVNAAKSVPVVLAPNFSAGVNTLFWLARQAARFLGDDFDIEIVEMHHRAKRDAPSGTARRLLEILCENSPKDVAHGRAGSDAPRKRGEIGVHAVRGGDVVGDHQVIFAGDGERLELVHRASSRETFARGALRAARWVVGKAPGLYSMEDVLGLSDAK